MFMKLMLVFMVVMLGAVAGAQEPPAYVGSDACSDCHRNAATDWQGSHHALAWTWPSPETVKADFDDTTFTHDGMTARFRVEADGRYHVSVTEKDGTTTDYPVHSVAGVEPLQQYLLETAPGRLQSFDVVWDTERGGWFHLYPDLELPPGDGLHWTGPYKTWNARCAECHATGFEKNYDFPTRTYDSTQSEIGVGCEACHGPGAAHLDWAKTPEAWKGLPGLDAYGFSMALGSTEATTQQCATCHSRREAFLDDAPLPGTPYHDSFALDVLRPDLYQPDGQILEEVYVYGSFLQSRMYAQGVGCLNCHDAHTADLVAEGNAVCTQCHSPDANPDFPTLKRAGYDTPEHHFHAQGSKGAECKSCHAPERVYMGNDWRADHSFRIPRPDLSAETGASDACTTCHVDRDARWAAAQIAEWYPASAHRDPHYGQVLAHGAADPDMARGDLITLAQDRTNTAIIRATALWLLQQTGDSKTAEQLAPLLSDGDPLVRAAAVDLQRLAPADIRVARVVPTLDDPLRSVRIAAARVLFNLPVAQIPATGHDSMRSAWAEWQTTLSNRLDSPETHLVLGGIALSQREIETATTAFREVVMLDPQRIDAWVMLTRISAATQGDKGARTIISEALNANPTDPVLRQLGEGLGVVHR